MLTEVRAESSFDHRRLYQRLYSHVARCSVLRRLGAGESLYTCGAENHNIYFIESGCVKVLLLSRSARQCLLDICSQGDMVGESGLLATERAESVVAMSPCVLRAVSRVDFVDIIFKYKLVEETLQYFAAKLQDQQQVMSHFVTADSEGRLAATILRLARKLGKPCGGGLMIDERITQEELAEIVGTTRSRVGHFLKGFQEAGLIERPSRASLLVNEERLDEHVQSYL